jgi:hypothetical protein
VTYETPPPVQFEDAHARYRLADSVLTVEMKADVKEPRDALALVQPTVEAWQAAADLERGWGEMRFEYERTEVAYKNAPPGFMTGRIEIKLGAMKGNLTGTVVPPVRTTYPTPPGPFALTPNARSMLDRLRRSEEGAEHMPSMAYFCLTVVEEFVRGREGDPDLRRPAIAAWLGVEYPVVKALGNLSSERGGATEGRKAKSKSQLTQAERRWMSEAVRKLIRHVGIIESGCKVPPLTMADLPSLTLPARESG